MINQENQLYVDKFLKFQEEAKQNDRRTIKAYRSRLQHLLQWAQENQLSKAPTIKPTFPAFLECLKNRTGGLIGAASFSAFCKTSRAFFLWAIEEYPVVFQEVGKNWIISIRPPRLRHEQAEMHVRQVYTLEEVIRLVSCPVDNLCLQRTQAAAAFLFLSGMRISAFASLPIACVDLGHMRVLQLPERGVLTKNRKAAITTLLNIPELLKVVKDWDSLVREKLGKGFWFAHLDRHGDLSFEKPNQIALANRKDGFCEDLKALCVLAGVEYKSAHKFRHGHAVYGIKHARDMKELKAVSQNLMHSSIGITDGVYGNLTADDINTTIANLGGAPAQPAGDMSALLQVLAKLQANPSLIQTILAAPG